MENMQKSQMLGIFTFRLQTKNAEVGGIWNINSKLLDSRIDELQVVIANFHMLYSYSFHFIEGKSNRSKTGKKNIKKNQVVLNRISENDLFVYSFKSSWTEIPVIRIFILDSRYCNILLAGPTGFWIAFVGK